MEYGLVVVWWVILVAVGVLGAPIASALLRELPDRGVGLAIPVGLAVFGLLVYWLGHIHYGPTTVLTGFVAFAGIGLGLLYRGARIDRRRGLEVLAVFTAGYLLLIGVRAVDPAIQPAGGEKFIDYGLLNAILRTDRLPPEDMWFAGKPVRYHYGGHLIAATLATLGDVAPRYAYNTALAGFYGTLVAGAYGLTGAIGAVRGASYRWAGAAGAFFVGIASNLVPPVQAVLWALPEALARPLAEAIAATVGALTTAELLNFGQGSPTPYYWIPSRVIGVTINEFPLFAWVNGDLHGHMTSTPILLVVIGLAFAYYLSPATDRWYRRGIILGAFPAVTGLISVVNAWSFPTPAGIAGLTMLFASGHPADLLPGRVGAAVERIGADGWRSELVRMGVVAGLVITIWVLGVLWVTPFFLVSVLGSQSTRTIGLVLAPGPPSVSSPVALLLVHGVFLAVFVRLLGPRLAEAGDRRVLAGTAGVLLLGALAGRLAVLVLVAPILLSGWYLLRRTTSVGFETVLVVAGAGLVVLVEVIYLNEQAGPGRFNTVFKYYAQVWIIWAIAAGAAIMRPLPPSIPGSIPEWWRRLRPILAIGLVLSLSLYGAIVLGGHFTGAPDPTLDATVAVAERHPAEWEAIRYLDTTVAGQPNMVSAPGTRIYRWVNVPSSFTGIPTLAGWIEEVGYRGSEPYQRRVRAVRTIYTGSWAERARLLKRYEVEFIYVGPVERDRYGAIAFGDHPAISVFYRNDAVTVYRVNRSAL